MFTEANLSAAATAIRQDFKTLAERLQTQRYGTVVFPPPVNVPQFDSTTGNPQMDGPVLQLIYQACRRLLRNSVGDSHASSVAALGVQPAPPTPYKRDVCPEGTEDAVRVERDGTRSKFEGMPHTVVFVLL
eukprot:SAG31_NODE_16133_length_721_cov_3.604502_1_plen_130_part_01